MPKTILEIQKKDRGRDETTIARLAKQIVAKALSPEELLLHVDNFIEQETEDAEALRCAIDARYLDYKEIADEETKEAHYQLQIIEEQLMLHIGLEIGRRVSRD